MTTKQVPQLALDIETLSLRPTAAIISIAAKPFFMSGDEVPDQEPFSVTINATTCAMMGLSFDQDTINWWAKKRFSGADTFTLDENPVSIQNALCDLQNYYIGACQYFHQDFICVWCQGSDFDIPILRNAYSSVDSVCKKFKESPWPHHAVRDARTYILQGMEQLGLYTPGTDPKKSYEQIPKCPDWVPHLASSDVDLLIWNVRYIHQQLSKLAVMI